MPDIGTGGTGSPPVGAVPSLKDIVGVPHEEAATGEDGGMEIAHTRPGEEEDAVGGLTGGEGVGGIGSAAMYLEDHLTGVVTVGAIGVEHEHHGVVEHVGLVAEIATGSVIFAIDIPVAA